MKWFVVADIHGRLDLLQGLLGKWKKNYHGHRLAFLGDMVDRGPESFKVVDTVKRLTEERGAIALLGNHEDMMLEYYSHKWVDKNDIWQYNGGDKTIRSYGEATELYGQAKFFEAFGKTHAEWMKKLPFYYEDDEVWFSHAPIPDERFLTHHSISRDFRQDKFACTWTFHGEVGATEESVVRDLGKVAVYGHVHALREGIMVPRVYKKPNSTVVYADTGAGCWPGAPLAAAIIEDGKYVGFQDVWPK